MKEETAYEMHVKILNESDISLALYGLGLSHGLTSDVSYDSFKQDAELMNRLYKIALKLAPLDNGHNKFLESMQVWLEIRAPRFVWQDLATYRIGISTQSEATNHTLMRQPLTLHDFELGILEDKLAELNALIADKDFLGAKRALPESFMQKRIICTNYKCLKNIIQQRKNHKLPHLRYLSEYLMNNLVHRALLK